MLDKNILYNIYGNTLATRTIVNSYILRLIAYIKKEDKPKGKQNYFENKLLCFLKLKTQNHIELLFLTICPTIS